MYVIQYRIRNTTFGEIEHGDSTFHQNPPLYLWNVLRLSIEVSSQNFTRN